MIDRRKILHIRRQMPIMDRFICMNWGHSGPSPRPVLRSVQEVLEREARLGPFHPKVTERRDAVCSRARALLGRVIGARPEEMALTANATAGINLVARSLDWRRGDEVIISNAEHPGGFMPWFILRDRCGIRVHQIPVDGGDGQFLETLSRRLNRKTRVVCISHVAWLSGYRYPLQEVSKLLAGRNVFLAVDGAQAAGALRFNVGRSGCDFYAFPGQKWLMGPQGTGALYVRKGLQGKISLPGGGYNSVSAFDLASASYAPYPDGRRFEVSTESTALFAGLAKGADRTLDLGLAAVERRILALAGRLLNHLRDVPNLELLSHRRPGNNPAHSGLISFRVGGMTAAEVVETLRRREGILVREVPARPPGVRVSLHYVNLEEEVDRLTEAVLRLARRASGAEPRRRSAGRPATGGGIRPGAHGNPRASRKSSSGNRGSGRPGR